MPNFINDFQIHDESENAREAIEIYDTIKEGGSIWILGHLMQVPASSHFFTLSRFWKISITNLFLSLLNTRFLPSYSFATIDSRNKLSTHIYRIFVYLYHSHLHKLYRKLSFTRELPRNKVILNLYEESWKLVMRKKKKEVSDFTLTGTFHFYNISHHLITNKFVA